MKAEFIVEKIDSHEFTEILRLHSNFENEPRFTIDIPGDMFPMWDVGTKLEIQLLLQNPLKDENMNNCHYSYVVSGEVVDFTKISTRFSQFIGSMGGLQLIITGANKDLKLFKNITDKFYLTLTEITN